MPGEVAEDPEPGFQGDVAEQPPSGPAVTFPFGELRVVERGDRGGQSRGNGVQLALPPCGSAAAGLVAWHHQPVTGEEPFQCPALGGQGAVRPDGAVRDLPGAG